MEQNFGQPQNFGQSQSQSPGDPMAASGLREWERHYSLAMHLTLLAWHLAIPVIPVLVMWLIKRDESAFVRDHGREALNFQISLLIYGLIGVVLMPLLGLGVLVIIAAYVLAIVGMILGAVAASKGRYYRYPACLRLVG